MLPEPPRVSIITVVYNGMPAIEPTLQSIVDLAYERTEIIVIDGGSTDGTLDVIRKFSDRISFWESTPDKGIYDAMNKGIDRATGEWVNFMNSGDRFASGNALDFFKFESLNQVDIVYGDATIIYPGFETIYPTRPLSTMWKAMPFCHQATFARLELMKNYRFDTTFRLSADFEFVFRSYMAGKRFKKLDKLICLFDFREGASKRHMLRSVDERRDAVLKYDPGITRRLYYFFFRLYIRISIPLKSIFGHSLTTWITKSLRR